MKKILIVTATLLTGGLALPAAAQSQRGYSSSATVVFVSGYLHCGTPIYSKKVRYGNTYRNVRLSGYELQRYLDRQRRSSAKRHVTPRVSRDRVVTNSRQNRERTRRR